MRIPNVLSVHRVGCRTQRYRNCKKNVRKTEGMSALRTARVSRLSLSSAFCPWERERARKCRSYNFSTKLNEGTFGVVFKGKLEDGSKLPEGDDGTRALKKLKADKHPGFPVTALREIMIMQQLVDPSTSQRHPNIGVLQGVVVDPESLSDLDKGAGVSMVMDYMNHDLAGEQSSPARGPLVALGVGGREAGRGLFFSRRLASQNLC